MLALGISTVRCQQGCRSLKVVKKLGATEIVVEATQAPGSVRVLTSTLTCSGSNQRSRWQRRASALSRCCWPNGDGSSTRRLLRNLHSSVTRLCLVGFPGQRSARVADQALESFCESLPSCPRWLCATMMWLWRRSSRGPGNF